MKNQQPQRISAVERQREIYVGGMSGQKPLLPIDFQQLEQMARERMEAAGFAYVAGGAGQEQTMRRNESAFENWKIVPRMLRDVSERDLSIELFGRKLPTPFLLAPIGVLEMAHKHADLAVAKACARMGVPMIFSNQASVAMEDCAAVMGDAPRWFQLYWSKSNELVSSLVHRAEAAGCEAIVVTLDTSVLGWRQRDLELAFLPFLRGMGIAQYSSDPVFKQLLAAEEQEENMDTQPSARINLTTISNLLRLMQKYPGNTLQNFRSQEPLKAVRKFINIFSRPSLTWKELAFLREQTKLPILLKGILHPDDACMAVDHGINGLIVSNHGGRQVDGAVSTIEMLPEIVDAVNDQLPILFDSGVRGGAHVFKALALGAKAVCIGRPYVYGLALKGQVGVEEVIKNFISDFELTMGLTGCKNISEINRTALRPA